MAGDSLVAAGFDAVPAQVAIMDLEGEIVYTNQAWRTFGAENGLEQSRGDVGSNYLSVCNVNDDPDVAHIREGLQALIAGTRDTFSFEYPCHSPDQRRWFTMQSAPYDHDGERYVLVMHVDITERRLAEERVREQAAQMEAFAKLLSHDLRNPLSVALADAHDRGASPNSTLVTSLERMETILEDALVLARTDEVAETQAARLDKLVEDAWGHVRTKGATLEVVDGLALRVDPALVSHLFENLFRNSIEHGGDDVSIRVGSLEEADSDSRNHNEGGFFVEDNGPGMPPDVRDRAFETGYTTSPDGTGFGLAIVEHVTSAHGWSITARDGTDGGARFEITGVSMVPVSNSCS